MSEIIRIDGSTVQIGTEDGKIIDVPIACLQFSNPSVGDKVNIYKSDNETIVRRTEQNTSVTSQSAATYRAVERKMNKHVFVWIGTFLFVYLGVDRFMRGQTGLGICKLLFGVLTVGIWYLVDWIVAMVNVYGNTFRDSEDVVFINGKYAK
jgi:TM2 domain-containing membrane protein YozV